MDETEKLVPVELTELEVKYLAALVDTAQRLSNGRAKAFDTDDHRWWDEFRGGLLAKLDAAAATTDEPAGGSVAP